MERNIFSRKMIYVNSSDIHQRCVKISLKILSHICHTISFWCVSGNPVRKSNVNHDTRWWMCPRHWSKEFLKLGVSKSFLKEYWLNVFAGKLIPRKYFKCFMWAAPTQLNGCPYEWLSPTGLQIPDVRIFLLKF